MHNKTSVSRLIDHARSFNSQPPGHSAKYVYAARQLRLRICAHKNVIQTGGHFINVYILFLDISMEDIEFWLQTEIISEARNFRFLQALIM